MKIEINKTNECDVMRHHLYYKWVENDRLKGILALVAEIVPPCKVKLRGDTARHILKTQSCDNDNKVI